ncbi:MAG: 4Fe-4S binding protein, partial [Desulfobacteraceae bacterium]|nr:4Fe-4S binding protein [Desulfobacteraceae bacterium]
MPSNRTIKPSTLSLSDLPWQIAWDKEKCTLCGKCTTICPVQAIELKVFRKKNIIASIDLNQNNKSDFQTYFGINQKKTIKNACMGCGMCTLICPNNAIIPDKNFQSDRLKFHINQGGEPRKRGGRRNSKENILDKIKFIRISMLTDPALDAGRHEFELCTLLGRILPPKENIKQLREHGWIPPVRE